MSSGFREYLEEQFAPFGDVTLRTMFGGLGVFRQGLMFGLVAEDTLYLKTDETNLADFEGAQSEPFIYTGGKGDPIPMSYWRAPESVYDDPDEFRRWAEIGFAAAVRNDGAKPRGKRKRRPV